MNQKSLHQLGDIDADQRIRIALFSDSHQNYEELDKVIEKINKTPDVDFVLTLGDFTNAAYNFEYDQFLKAISKLRRPVLVTLGNHDAIGAGLPLYRKAFGPPNFFFESEGFRYVIWHSANLEDPGGFDPAWLIGAVDGSSKPVFIFTHVPLDSSERFKNGVRKTLAELSQNPKVFGVFSGHNHHYALGNIQGTVSVQCPRVSDGWLLLEIQRDGISIQRQDTGEVTWFGFKRSQ